MPIPIQALHHIAIIVSDYAVSKRFYTELLGFEIVKETFRSERSSWKLDLSLGNRYVLELFSFPSPPPRLTQPEALGLRHIAFSVENLDKSLESLSAYGLSAEPIRIDSETGKRFLFFRDPDNLPIELYEE